ncbi:hypothetical protein NEF87_003918 [Candidatus Lokiarchaeum ossiferum]|uniref:Ribbon-helix-helix protein CopG domain-containing protein n=1 Tax=Candidatus Lokiarchaeum ossiferum TaxID=2951803 RepID=A0ABY6HVS7_9ARCH|nr:hypothetical protein NEF87_003918 [Candidatus Lokiarchaeum sp. B-35]
METKKKKERVLGIRLEEQDYQRFSDFCDQHNMKMSQVARKALLTYAYIIYNPQVNPKLIFAKNQFKYIIQCLTEEEIRTLVDISIGNGTTDMKKLENYHPKVIYETEEKTEVNYQIETLVTYVFSEDGENWFNTIDYQFNENVLIVSGVHELGNNFSLYVRDLLCAYTKMHNYVLVEEVFTSKKVQEIRTFGIELKFDLETKLSE